MGEKWNVCAKVARHPNVNEDERVMEAVAVNKQQVQGAKPSSAGLCRNGLRLLYESGHAKQTGSVTSEPAEDVITAVV